MKFWKTWNRFFFGEFDPLPAAFFRITLGLTLVVSFLANHANWNRNYSPDGIPGLYIREFGRPVTQWWSIFYWTTPHVPVLVFWWIALAAALCYLVGYRTKLAALILFLIVTAMVHRDWWATNAEDTTFRMYLYYSFFAPVADRLSVDGFLRRQAGVAPPVRRLWTMRLIQFHVLLIYLISTPQKLSFDASWPAGDALYYVMINPLWSRFPWPWLFYSAFVSKTITYGSLLLEGTFPFLVWVKPLRRYLVLAMILFHCSMAITLRHIAFFSIAFGCGLWTFFSADDLYYFRDAARSACAHLRTAKSARAHA